jgi:hypothetical protein
VVVPGGGERIEGTTLRVYVYVVKAGRPLGPRDVMRGLNLSSPSVAYRHLQKLEEAALLQKDEHGEYVAKRKVGLAGFHWVGRSFLPTMMFYFFVFLGLFVTEATILVIHWQYETYEQFVFFGLGLTITGMAMAFFLVEGIKAMRKLNSKETE